MHRQSSERWAPIPDAPGYEASSHGGIRKRQAFRIGEILTYAAPKLQQGYAYTYIGRTLRTTGVHRAVLLAFADPPPAVGKWYAHHIDGVRHHNCLDNLTWVDGATHARLHSKWAEYLLPDLFLGKRP